MTNVANGVSKTISSLTAGMYSLTVTDSNGCTTSIPVNVGPGANVMISGLTVSPINCYGGTATVSFKVSGGTAPYRSCLSQGNQCFSSCISCKGSACNLTQTFTRVPAGNYTLVVTDANGCSASLAVTVNQPQPVKFTIQTSSQGCPKGQSKLTVNATGGTAPYSYQLDGGSFRSSGSSYSFGCVKNGNHSVTVKDSRGCTSCGQVRVPRSE